MKNFVIFYLASITGQWPKPKTIKFSLIIIKWVSVIDWSLNNVPFETQICNSTIQYFELPLSKITQLWINAFTKTKFYPQLIKFCNQLS